MPNPAEMAKLLGCPPDEVTADPAAALAAAVGRLGTVVTLRMAETWTAGPGTPAFLDQSGNAGLATSGSGDVLAGVIGGLAARGADALTATLWANHLHAAAGERCAVRLGSLGYLARELLDELPRVLRGTAG
jgi:NAD(P)H-hydrate repair Nnr-like enzyme with NAD(P)H-hydrate dehydratase domain